MKKSLLRSCCLLVLLISILAGCASQPSSAVNSPSSQPSNSSAQPASIEEQSSNPSPAESDFAASVEMLVNLQNEFSEKIVSVHYSGSQLFIQAGDTLWSYGNTGPEQITPLKAGASIALQPTNNGFAVIESNPDSGNFGNGIQVYLLDGDTNLMNTVDLSSTMEAEIFSPELCQVTVSPDGSKIAFATIISGVQLFDISTQQLSSIYAMPDITTVADGDHILASIEGLAFTNDGNALLYYGNSWIKSGATTDNHPSYGSLQLNGAPDNHLISNNPSRLSTQSNSVVFSNAGMVVKQDTRYTDGNVLFVNSSLVESSVKLSDGSEGDIIYLSENGRYLASVVDKQANGGGFVVKVYELNSGSASLISEHSISVNAYTYPPNIVFLEDSNMCMAIVGNRQADLNTYIEAWEI